MPATDTPEPDARPAAAWLAEIDAALGREDAWRKRGMKVVQRYRDERDTAATTMKRVNILWSNTEVLKAALYPRTANPDVRRRFTDARKGDRAAKNAAEALERALSYGIDVYDVDTAIIEAISDMLLPGRGQGWVSYEPEIEDIGEAQPPDEDDDRADEPATEARIVGQKLCVDYVYWEDFCHGLARRWKDVPWVARRHALRQKQFDEKFPDAPREKGGATFAIAEDKNSEKFVEVWEIWAKDGKERLYVARGYLNILQADPDPYQLSGFFPCPAPLYSVTTTDRAVPVPEFTQYQDQAAELDALTTRIDRLTDQLRWRGIYDATVDKDGATLKALETADDGAMLPAENWAQIAAKGGIDGVLGFVPIEKIYPIVAALNAQRQMLIQEIYQVTGISDIIRGSTDPRETKGAQQLKAQFGSMRMQKRQREVQRFIRDLYRIEAEIIAEHFTPDVLAEITGIDLPTAAEQAAIKGQLAAMQMQAAGMGGAPGAAPQQPPPEMLLKASGPNWDDVIGILRSDKLRSYRVDIETDATALQDAEAEKASRIEFMGAMEKLLAGAYTAAIQAPQMLPLVKELTLFGMRTFKPGKSLEEAVETAFDELQKNPPQPPQAKEAAPPKQDDPAKAQAAMMEAQRKAQKDQADAQLGAAELRRKSAKDQADNVIAMRGLQLEARRDGIELELAGREQSFAEAMGAAELGMRAREALMPRPEEEPFR